MSDHSLYDPFVSFAMFFDPLILIHRRMIPLPPNSFLKLF